MESLGSTHRWILAAVAALLLGVIGLSARMNSAAPPVAFVAGSNGFAEAASPSPETLPRYGGASSGPPAPSQDPLVVHVAGAVKRPGVYSLAPGKRIVDAVHAAGGPTARADLDAVNLAAKVADGEQILIPRKGEGNAASRGGRGTALPRQSASPRGGKATPAMVAVNTASAEELDALPGVGPATARKIIDYRTQHGPFTSPDGLLAVKGIGPKKLEKMRPYLLIR